MLGILSRNGLDLYALTNTLRILPVTTQTITSTEYLMHRNSPPSKAATEEIMTLREIIKQSEIDMYLTIKAKELFKGEPEN